MAIHIGGTNGKGSTCAFVANELRAYGWRVGLYTSPHLISPVERITVDGVPISEEAFTEWTAQLKPHIERLDASFFEATTALAFADLAARGVDIAVIEVGLGGRLDATNVLTPLVSAVTKIALEHVEYLGSDLKGIARENAGIAKPQVPFVTGEADPDIRAELVKDGMRVVAQALAESAKTIRRPLNALVGIRNDKDWRAMLDSLRPLVDRLTLTVPPSIPLMQRWSIEDMGPDVLFEPDFERALHDIQEGAGTILVTGSFHTVGDAMARLPGFAPVG